MISSNMTIPEFNRTQKLRFNVPRTYLCLIYKIPSHVMVNLYYSLIYPYLTYCNMIWSSTYTSRLSHLVILQKKAIRIITKSPYNSHTAPLFHMHGFLNIEQ